MWEKLIGDFTPLKQMWALLLTGLLLQTTGFMVSYESLLTTTIGATISLTGLSYVLRKACSFAFIDLLFYGIVILAIAAGTLFVWSNALISFPSFVAATPSLVIAFLTLYLSCSALIEGKPATKTFSVKEQMLYQLTRVQLYNLAKRHMEIASIKWKKNKLVKLLSHRLNAKEIEMYLLRSKKPSFHRKGSKGSNLSLTLGGTLLSLSFFNVLPSTTAILGASMLIQSILAYKGKIKSI
ncbi:MAG: hypothetical protein QXP17_00715 [Candidatus Jordarchaeales archaeon]